MQAFTLLVTVALAAAANSASPGLYGDGSNIKNSDYFEDNSPNSHYHEYDHFHHDHDHHHHEHDHSSHEEPDAQKTFVPRSVIPEADPIPDVASLAGAVPNVAPITEGAAASSGVNEHSPIDYNDPIAEGAALAGITENSSPLVDSTLSSPYVYQVNPYSGYPTQYLPPQAQYPQIYEYPAPYGQGLQYPPPPSPPGLSYGTPPPSQYIST